MNEPLKALQLAIEGTDISIAAPPILAERICASLNLREIDVPEDAQIEVLNQEDTEQKISKLLRDRLVETYDRNLILKMTGLSSDEQGILIGAQNSNHGKAVIEALTVNNISLTSDQLVALTEDGESFQCIESAIKVAPKLLLFVKHQADAELSINRLSPAAAGLQVMACILNGHNLDAQGLRHASAISNTIPSLEVTFGNHAQLSRLRLATEVFLKTDKVDAFIHGVNHTWNDPTSDPTTTIASSAEIPQATPAKPRKKLCVGMATYDDYDGVYFSVQALRMFHPEVQDDIEILVLDNNPGGPCGQPLKNLDNNISNYRYIPITERVGTSIRDLIFANANADYVLCMDCHVLIEAGAVAKLINFFDEHPDCPDLLQGPMLGDDLHGLLTHFKPEWSHGMYGVWGHDERGDDPDGAPFEIPMQGLGLFASRKDKWLGFNPQFQGFGGEEGYIHEKVRQAGGKALCLPFLRWLHRFQRPMGIPYPINWQDRIVNYLIGHSELGLDIQPVLTHFEELLNAKAVENAVAAWRNLDSRETQA